MIRQQRAVAAVTVAQVAGHGRVAQTIGACCSAKLSAGMLAGTVAILAQGTSWAVAVTQAFLPVDRTFKQTFFMISMCARAVCSFTAIYV